MKKILLSLAILAAVGAVVVAGTTAFFSDTETSTGNTFTAGAIDLTVDSEQHYNGNVCVATTDGQYPYIWSGDAAYPKAGTPCDGSWELADLGAQKFFNFLDVKPGDSGENTISLHVDSNDAYACVDVDITANDDNGITTPEDLVDGSVLNASDGTTTGDLAQGIYFTAWADDGDNIWEAGEQQLFSNLYGPASDVLGGKSYTLANSITGPLAGNTTRYIGLAWCAGTMNVTAATPTANAIITCDGNGLGNIAQTDTMTANIAFRVEQARNNPNFTCVLPTRR
jgi:predicted ribosomally synthesized peptide with SipW-like signal peptide